MVLMFIQLFTHRYNIKKPMDQCVKLTKSIKQDFYNQFTTHLGHCSAKLNAHHRWQLLFQVIVSRVNSPFRYIHHILKHETTINKPYENKAKHPYLLGKTPLMAMCQMSNFDAVKALLQYKDIDLALTDGQGRNCLFYALRNESEEECYQMIREIVGAQQALANSCNLEGTTILIEALQKKSLRVMELLLTNLADPNHKCKITGNTALHKALLNNTVLSQKKKDIILLLLNFKADPYLQNKSGKSCFDIAKEAPKESDWFLKLYKQADPVQDEPNVCHFEINSVTKEDEDTIRENLLSEIESDSTEEIQEEEFSIDRLTAEIDNLARNSQKRHEQSWRDIAHIYDQLAKIGQHLYLKIDIIGSYATSLWTPNSDIDIVFTNCESSYIYIQEMLVKIYQFLKPNCKELGIKDIYINKNINGNSFPNIKIDLEQRLNYRKIDITIFQKKNNGQKYVRYIRERLQYNPLIKPVFFALQKMLRSFNLNNPSKNGLKTYAIFLMILICSQRFKSASSGQLFMSTIYFYAHIFFYQEQQDGTAKINIYDPLNQHNNVGGRKTDVNRLREMFKALDYGLRVAAGRGILDFLGELAHIFVL